MSPQPLGLEYLGAFEKWGRYFVLRPSLQISFTGPRRIEEVRVVYPQGHYDPIFSQASTATVTPASVASKHREERAKYVRAWVFNFAGFPARRCQVFVERILHNGKLVEEERSPLHWADYRDMYEFPYMRWRYKNGAYIDVCAADSSDHKFYLLSLKGTRGYHRFGESGIYQLELSAEAAKPCSFGHMVLTLQHDAKNFKNLRVLSSPSKRTWTRWC